jgi:hypothetical protein
VAFLPTDHRTAVSKFLEAMPTRNGAPVPTNSQVLALVSSLRDPIGHLPEPHRFLDQIGWASLGYYNPGDRFHLDREWLMREYDNPYSLETMLRGWAASQPRTWLIKPSNSQILKLDLDAVQREALYWWERLQAARAAGVEPMPPGPAVAVMPSLQPRQLSTRMFWGVLTAFVAAGLGAAVLISRDRR